MLDSKLNIWFAMVSGLSASFGSFFGKLSSSDVPLQRWCRIMLETFICTELHEDESTENTDCQSLNKNVLFVSKAFFFALMVICNGAVWTFFVKALCCSKSSLPATIVSTAVNFTISAALGILFFKEATSMLWWCGTILVILGLVLISQGEKESSSKKAK